ncbi:MAG: hypothetical protein KFH87_06755 [Bacteroidetes bacterium]|nr:hypothetical protein [Bacteroidota bacterium]
MKGSMTLVVAVMTLLNATLLNGQSPNELDEARKDLLEQTIAMMEDRVFPVMTQWREQFESRISERDLRHLNTLRERYTLLRENIDHNMRARRAAWQNNDLQTLVSLRSLLKSQFDERRKLLNDVGRITTRNLKHYQYLTSRIDSTVEEWRAASMRIFIDWFGKYRSVLAPAMHTADGESLAQLMAACKNMRLEILDDRAGALFLLWDGEDYTQEIRLSGLPDSPLTDLGPDPARVFFLRSADPNPFTEQTNIHFSIPLSGGTLIKVFDARGTEMNTLLDEPLRTGNHVVILRGEQLVPGTYYIRGQGNGFFDAISVRRSTNR